MRLGGIYVSIRGDTKQYKLDLAKAKTMTERTAVHIKHTLKSINWAAVGASAAAAGAAIAFGMKKAIDAASNLEETVGKFDVVFKDHAQQAENMADVLVESYAMSTREAKLYLSSVQDLLVPMGMASDAAIIMSNEVVKLAADLGSFNNLPTEQVMMDIQSALVGNFETMKKYGVVLNETVIKQEAMNQGLYDGKGMVDANVKAYTAFNLMLKGSAAAIGDQQRTMGSYANQMKQLRANIEDISASIGNKLLPIVTEYVHEINMAIKQNPQIIEQLGDIARAILELTSALTKGVFWLSKWENVWGKALDAMLPAVGLLRTYLKLTKQLNQEVASSAEGVHFPIPARPSAAPKPVPIPKPVPKPKPNKGESEDEKNRRAFIEYELERVKELYEMQEEAAAAKLEIEKQFNEEYNALGKTRFELERERLAEQVELWRQAGIEENKIAELTSARNLEIARAEQQAKLDIYQDIAGGIAGTFQMIAQAGGKQSKKAFAVYKAFAMVEAAIAGHKAVLNALAHPSGPPFSFILAGLAGAKAAMQIGMIASAQPPSYDTGGISNAKGIYQTGNIQEAHVPIPSGKIPVEITGNETQSQEITIMNTIDPSVMETWMASPAGQDAIFNTIGNQPQKLRRLLR